MPLHSPTPHKKFPPIKRCTVYVGGGRRGAKSEKSAHSVARSGRKIQCCCFLVYFPFSVIVFLVIAQESNGCFSCRLQKSYQLSVTCRDVSDTVTDTGRSCCGHGSLTDGSVGCHEVVHSSFRIPSSRSDEGQATAVVMKSAWTPGLLRPV